MTKTKAIVQFDYEAEASDELSLKIGDVLLNIEQVEEGWCKGSLNGKTGMFPDNFVKLVEDTPPSSSKPGSKKKKELLYRMKVTFPYDAANNDELKLEVSDIIDVFKEEEEGWASGQLNGKEGVFPTNFAVKYTEEISSAGDTASGEIQNHSSKKVKGVGFGNIFSDKQFKLRQASVGEAETKVVKEEQTKSQVAVKNKTSKPSPPTSQQKPKSSQERCRAIFDYEAETVDELTLVKGEIVIITNKKCADVGWWEGEIVDESGSKRHGVFPDNFVVMLPNGEDKAEEKSLSKELPEVKSAEKKPKSKSSETDGRIPKAKASPSPVLKVTNSLKRPAPQVPPVANKATPAEAPSEAELLQTVASTSNAPKLTHYKKACGPKNRRKPDAANRRERANDASEESFTITTDELIVKPDEMEADPEPAEPDIAPKRDTKRGIQVMPSPTGGADGETPSWLKSLKSRSSQKKPSPSLTLSPNKEDIKETPDWLSNLRKKPSAASVVEKSTFADPTKHLQNTVSSKSTAHPVDNHAPPRPPSPKEQSEDKNENQKNAKKYLKSQSESDVLANIPPESIVETKPEGKPALETKKVAARPTVALQPPKHAEFGNKKPIAAAKPKPPPPKAKPALPGAKPVPHVTSSDELREELKSLKEMMAHMQEENKKEISRLTKELNEEKKQRISLEADVARLRKRIAS